MSGQTYLGEDFEVAGGSPVLSFLVVAAILLGAVFFIRQITFLPMDTETVKGIVLNESKDKANSYKKYFPKPYSINDLARGDA